MKFDEPGAADITKLTLEAQKYADETGDANFALSCFGWLIPHLSEDITGIIDSIRDRASLTFNEARNPDKPPVDFSPVNCNKTVTFTTENLASGALSLALEGLIEGLKGSGKEHQTTHLNRLIAGYIIGSKIAENSDATPWAIGDSIHNLSLPTLTGIFNTLSAPKPNADSLPRTMEDPEQVNHYRFAGAAAKFVLSCSLADMGALKRDVLAISERLDRRMAKNFGKVADDLIETSLSDSTPEFYRETEAGLLIAALNESYSLPAMFNAMSRFTPVQE
jgi:hypothetical protein